MKLNPDTILPTVFSALFNDGQHHLLGCRQRIFKAGLTREEGRSKKLVPPGEEWQPIGSSDKVIFPCMIEPGKAAPVRYFMDGGGRNWTLSHPGLLGISDHAAKAAIIEAWKGIKACYFDFEKLVPHMEFDNSPMIGQKQNGLAIWRMNAWLRWDKWNRDELSIPQRAEKLRAMGFHLTDKDLENAKREMRMPGTLREGPLT